MVSWLSANQEVNFDLGATSLSDGQNDNRANQELPFQLLEFIRLTFFKRKYMLKKKTLRFIFPVQVFGMLFFCLPMILVFQLKRVEFLKLAMQFLNKNALYFFANVSEACKTEPYFYFISQFRSFSKKKSN